MLFQLFFVYCKSNNNFDGLTPSPTKNQILWEKEEGGKRLTKKQLARSLKNCSPPTLEKTLSFKDIFRSLHLDTHPLKMLAIDIKEEMAWDGVTDNSHQLNMKGQVQEGVFQRKTNGKNPYHA